MINFGDKSLIIQYIQNFLKDNYNENIHLSDEYDKETHKALIEYLQLPEIIDSYSMKDLLLQTFTFREEQPPNALVDGGGIWNFNFELTLDRIKFYNRPISQCFEGGLRFLNEHLDDVDKLCKEHGWYLASYDKFKYVKNTKLNKEVEFVLIRDSRKQLLPSKEIINMINLSMNDYLLGKCFLDEDNGYHGVIQNSNHYKISYITAKPGDTFTISHGYKYACELAIGYTESSLPELKSGDYSTVNNIISYLNKSKYGEMNPGDYEIYKIPPDSKCKYLLIQMPYKDNLISPIDKQIRVKIGDINQDGIIDFDETNPNSDYMLLKNYVTAKALNQTPAFDLSGINLIAANINKDIDIHGNPIVDELDLKTFELAKEESRSSGNTIDFGESIYEKEINLSESDNDRLLIIYGNIELNNVDNELNIPLEDYQTKPWAIHDCFLPYILGSAIHSYSDNRDIEWLQKQIKKITPNYKGLRWGHYDTPESFKSNDYIKWNEIKVKYEYYQNGLYSGYILSSNDIYNSELRREHNMTLSDIKIRNGRIYMNGTWTGKVVLEDGTISGEYARFTLKELIKEFQIKCNSVYKYQTLEQIKFITGYLDPITEKYLKHIVDNLDNN